MPIYEYVCRECGERFEKLVSLSAATQRPACPSCQSTDTEKAISLCCSSRASGGASAGAGASCASTGWSLKH